MKGFIETVVILVFITSWIHCMEECPSVSAIKGHISIYPQMNCTVRYGPAERTGVFGVVPGRWYGLIEVTCGTCVDRIMSSFTSCDGCTFCIHDEMITDCQARVVPIILCVTVAALSFVISIYISRYSLFWLRVCGAKASVYRERKRQGKRDKILNVVRDLLIPPTVTLAADSGLYPTLEGIESEDGEVELRTITEPIVDSPLPEAEHDPSYIEVTTPPEPPRPAPRAKPERAKLGRMTLVGNKWVFVSMLVCICIPLNQCCSVEYISLSTITKCSQNSSCIDLHSISSQLLPEHSLCVSDKVSGKRLIKIDLIHTGYEYIYELDYFTSDYKFRISKVQRCFGAGGCWWDGSCKPQNGSHLEPTLASKLNNPEVSKYGWGCGVSHHYTGTCGHSTTCTWYLWEHIIERRRQKVYRLISRGWYVVVRVSTPDYSTEVVATSSSPVILPGMQALISPHSGQVPLRPTHAIEYEGLMYPVDASPRDQPIENNWGDIQISQSGKVAFPYNSIRCQVDGTMYPTCIHPDPTFKRLKDSLRNSIRVRRPANSANMLFSKERVPFGIAVHFATESEPIFVVNNASCMFRIISSYGCAGCHTLPDVIFEPFDVTSPGTVKVESNCSLGSEYLSCSDRVQAIPVFAKTDECCEFRVQGLVMTHCLHLIFLTELHEITMRTIGAEGDFSSAGDFFKSLGSNKLFAYSIPWSIIIGVGALILTKIFRWAIGDKILEEWRKWRNPQPTIIQPVGDYSS